MVLKSNQFLKFLLNLLIITGMIVIADQVVGGILQHYYFNQKSGLYYRTTYSIDSTNADVLVFGSSRANHHYVPQIFEDSLKMSFYNTGRDGNYILFNYAVFKAIVKRYTPKIVIFDINPGELNYDIDSYDRLSALLPYYKSHTEIREIIELKSPYEKYKLISAIYPYNSSLLTIATGNSEQNKTRKADIKGYVPLWNTIKDTILHSLEILDVPFDNVKINAVEQITDYCKKHKIRLIFVQSPIYCKISQTHGIEFFEKLNRDNHAIFWDFINYPDFLENPGMFQDAEHLNNSGATYFSRLVVNKINIFKSLNFEPGT